MELPPSTGSMTPVTYLEVPDARKTAASPTSEGCPISPMGVLPIAFAFLSGSLFNALADISVAIKPGAMQFTRMPFGESSTAIALVIPSIADLEAVYAITFGMPYREAMELI